MVQAAAAGPAVSHRVGIGTHQNARSQRRIETAQHTQHTQRRANRIAHEFRQAAPQRVGMLTMLYAFGIMTAQARPQAGRTMSFATDAGHQQATRQHAVSGAAPAPHSRGQRIAVRVVRAVPQQAVPFANAADWCAAIRSPRSMASHSAPPGRGTADTVSADAGFRADWRFGGAGISSKHELARKDAPPLPARVIPIRTSDDQPAIQGPEQTSPERRIEAEFSGYPVEAEQAIASLNTEVRNLLLQYPDIVSCCDAGLRFQELITKSITFLRTSDAAHAALARALQKSSGDYGSNAGEPMSLPVQKKIIRHWIVLNLFGESIEAWIQRKIIDGENVHYFRTSDLYSLVRQQAFRTKHTFHAYRRSIMTLVLNEELPMMAYVEAHRANPDLAHQRYIEMKLGDFEWGLIHAGRCLVQSLGLGKKFDLDESTQQGELLLAQLKAGTVPTEWWDFFRLPALIRYAQKNPALLKKALADGDEKMVVRALAEYAADHERFMAERFPLAEFQQRMNPFPTRLQLAQQEIDANCPGLSPSAYLNHPATTTCSSPDLPPGQASNAGSTNRETFSEITLPDINQKFQKQIDEIADLFQRISKGTLSMAWNALSDADFEHISRSEIRWASVRYSAADILNAVPFVGANHHARESLTFYPVPDVDFFIAQSPEQEEHIYALLKNGLEFVVLLVDRNITNYYRLFTQDLGKITNPDFKLKIHAAKVPIKAANDGLKVLQDCILEKSRREFSALLYIYGYEETMYEMGLRIAKSQLPFYTCLTTLAEDKPAEAVLSCPLDILLLVPGIGAFSRLSIKLGQLAGSGTLIAARNAMSGIALRSALQVVLKQAVSDIARYAMLPAMQEINKKTLTSLGLATLRSLDPGIELLGSIGVVSVAQFIRLGRSMTTHSRGFRELLDKLAAALPGLPPKMDEDSYQAAALTGMEQRVHVIRLGGDQLDGQDIYVRVQPETGMPYGRKYLLLADGTLDPVPVALAQRLQNVLQQGLGGKGAARQGLSWAREGAEIVAGGNRLVLQSPQSPLSPLSPRSRSPAQSVLPAQAGPVPLDQGSIAPANSNLHATVAVAMPDQNQRTAAQAVMPVAQAGNPCHAVASPGSQALNEIENLVRGQFRVDGSRIYDVNHQRYEYHIDWDIFIELRSKSIFAVSPQTGITRLLPRQAEARVPDITHDQRTAVIKAFGIDLDIGAILKGPAPDFSAAHALDKKISYIWVGDQAISQAVLDTMAINEEVASRSGYQISFYLSLQSFESNYEKLKKVLRIQDRYAAGAVPRHRIQMLETTDFYQKFSASRNFAQYQDAIDGNGGVATNYASAADILRLALLKDQGGLYMDVDDTLLPDLGKLHLKAEDHGIVLGGLLSSDSLRMEYAFGTSFFGAHKNSIVLDQILAEIERRYQLEENRLFYKQARPLETDTEAINGYAQKLLYLTGPGVFNQVIIERLPNVKNFVELARLIEITNKPEFSPLIEQVSKKIASEADICPLSAAHTIGSMNSWLYHR